MTTLRTALARRLAEAPIAPTDADPAARTELLHETPAERVLMRHTLRIETSPFSILDASEADAIRAYLEAATAPGTRHGYRRDWRSFSAWCDGRALVAMPAAPTTVACYLVDLAQQGRKVATLERRLSAIAHAHAARDQPTPVRATVVRAVLRGIRRLRGSAQVGKAPLLPDDLRAMVVLLDTSLGDVRDRALLLLGFAGAFRRSELVSLDVGDLVVRPGGLVVTLRRSKTDQEGQGTVKGIPRGRSSAATCPVRAVEAWLRAAQIRSGPLFRPVDRHGRVSARRLAPFTVVRVVKRLAAAAGLDPSLYAGHSLRAGLATAAAQAGASERAIMRQTGHHSERMVRRYIRDGRLFHENAADGLL
jgi:integrase